MRIDDLDRPLANEFHRHLVAIFVDDGFGLRKDRKFLTILDFFAHLDVDPVDLDFVARRDHVLFLVGIENMPHRIGEFIEVKSRHEERSRSRRLRRHEFRLLLLCIDRSRRQRRRIGMRFQIYRVTRIYPMRVRHLRIIRPQRRPHKRIRKVLAAQLPKRIAIDDFVRSRLRLLWLGRLDLAHKRCILALYASNSVGLHHTA